MRMGVGSREGRKLPRLFNLATAAAMVVFFEVSSEAIDLWSM